MFPPFKFSFIIFYIIFLYRTMGKNIEIMINSMKKVSLVVSLLFPNVPIKFHFMCSAWWLLFICTFVTEIKCLSLVMKTSEIFPA